MPTSHDVSARAGVSRATVSAVVNRTRFVSPELRERVEQAIRELNYEPNAVARSLKTNRTLSIGLILPTLYSPFAAPLETAIERVLTAAGYSLILCSSNEDEACEADMLQVMARKRVDGLLLVPVGEANGAHISRLIQHGTPIVFVDRRITEVVADTVTSDNFGAGRTATQHLVDSGCRRVAMIAFSMRASTAMERFEGYRSALVDNALHFDASLLMTAEDPRGDGAYECVLRLLDSVQPPDGLLIGADRLAPAALRALRDRRVAIPDSLQIVAFDDSPWAPLLQPSLTVVRQRIFTMGQKAAGLLLRRLQQQDIDAPQSIVLETELIVRESSLNRSRRDD